MISDEEHDDVTILTNFRNGHAEPKDIEKHILELVEDGKASEAIKIIYPMAKAHVEKWGLMSTRYDLNKVRRKHGDDESSVKVALLASQSLGKVNDIPALTEATQEIYYILEKQGTWIKSIMDAYESAPYKGESQIYDKPDYKISDPKTNAEILANEICKKAKNGNYTEALELLAPLVVHLHEQQEKGNEILGWHNDEPNTFSMLEQRYSKHNTNHHIDDGNPDDIKSMLVGFSNKDLPTIFKNHKEMFMVGENMLAAAASDDDMYIHDDLSKIITSIEKLQQKANREL